MSADPWFQSLFAERIGGANYGKGTEIYKFEKIKRAKRKALADRPDVQLLDFGIGENDDMAAPVVRETLARAANLVENRGYADNGIAAYKDAVAEFMKRQFGVTLDPVTEVCHCIGSKPAYAMLPACFINPGDVTLMTVPGYPVAGTWTKYLGGEVHRLPLRAENGFYPDLDGIPANIKRRAKMLVLNYPNSPTGAVATHDFYKRVIDWARTNQVIVVQDAAHMLLTYQGEPLSFFQVDGAKEVGVEVYSMSKGFNMIGWRLGWVCGHPKIVQAYADVKDNSDSGQFMAIQHASAEALRHAEIPQQVRTKYKRRLEKLVAALKQVGFTCEMPGGTYFLYTKAPTSATGRSFANAEEASQFLIAEQSVCCVPWDDAGAYLRFSVTYIAKDEAEEDALMAETVRRLKGITIAVLSGVTMAGHVFVRVSGYGWTLLPFAPFRMEQVKADPPTIRVEFVHPDGPRAATLRVDGPDLRFTTEPNSHSIEEIVEVVEGPQLDCWRLETDPFTCDWPDGFALWDQIHPFSLHGPESSMIWIQGPIPARKVPPPEGFVAAGQSLISITQLGPWTRIELAYEHKGRPWRQLHRVRDAGPDHKIGVTSQAPVSVAAETDAAGDLVASSMRPNHPA